MDKLFRLVLIAFLILAGLKIISTFFIVSPTIFADEYFYSKMAQSYFNFREFSVHGDFFQTYPPIYSVLISAAYYFKDMTNVYTFIKIINAIVSSLIIFPAFFLAKELLNEKKALLVSILISVLPMNLVFSGYVMAENLFYVLFLTASYFIYKSFKEDNLIYDAFAGIFIGLTILTRYLGLALLVPVGIVLLYEIFIAKKRTNKFIIFVIAGLAFGAWLFRNGYLFGFDMGGMLGTYIRDGYPVTFTPLSLAIWTILNFAMLIISTGFIFIISIFSNIRENFRKYRMFYLLFFSVVIAVLIMLAERTAGSALFKVDTLLELTGRPSARYIDVLAPLAIIGGFASLQSKKVSNKLIISLIFITILASQLFFFNLYPVNNMSLFWLGAISYLTKTLTNNIYVLTVIYSVILVSAIFVSTMLLKKINPNKLVLLMIIFFTALSLANIVAISINSNEWHNSSDGQLGLWINENIDGIILIDDKYCNEFDFRNTDTLCSKKNKSSLIGFWINDEIKIGNPNEVPANYIITRDVLTLEKIYELDGTFIYKSA
ncbi:MAG: glycosyltransferase family 39 protein [Nanoarchaeota archaeon]